MLAVTTKILVIFFFPLAARGSSYPDIANHLLIRKYVKS